MKDRLYYVVAVRMACCPSLKQRTGTAAATNSLSWVEFLNYIYTHHSVSLSTVLYVSGIVLAGKPVVW
jgi:hypothetical protein